MIFIFIVHPFFKVSLEKFLYLSIIKNLVSSPSLFCFMDGHHKSCNFSHFSALALMCWNLTIFPPNAHPSLATILHIFWHAFSHANLLAFSDFGTHILSEFLHFFIAHTYTQKSFQAHIYTQKSFQSYVHAYADR